MRFKYALATVIAVSALVTGAAWAHDPKEDEELVARHGLLQTVRFQFKPLGAFAKGDGPLPADAARRAEVIAELADVLPVAWADKDRPNSSTKPEAFAQKDKFLAGFKAMNTEALKLQAVAKGSDADAIKAQIAAVGKTCKSCHDDYKQKD